MITLIQLLNQINELYSQMTIAESNIAESNSTNHILTQEYNEWADCQSELNCHGSLGR